MYNFYEHHGLMSPHIGLFGVGDMWFFIILLVLWSVVWKGWALWVAAKRGEKVWFVVLLLLNTVGILEIFYLFVIAKQNIKDVLTPSQKSDTVVSPTTEVENKN